MDFTIKIWGNGRHSGVVAGTTASQQEGPGFVSSPIFLCLHVLHVFAWVLWLASASNLTTHNKVFRSTIWWDPGTSSNYSLKHFSLVSGCYQRVTDQSLGLCDWGLMCWTMLQWKSQHPHSTLCVNNMQIEKQLRLALCIIMIRKSDEEEFCKLGWLMFLRLNASNKYRTGDVTHYSISNCKTTQWMC